LKQVLIFGNVELTPAARNMLLQYGVDTIYFTRDGRYRGRYATPEPRNVLLRKKQFNLLDDKDFGLAFTRQVVSGKLTNMATLLMRIHRTRRTKAPASRSKEIRQLIKKLDQADSVDSIRGYEGRGSALYFGCFGHGFIDSMGFSRRVRRPPTDPVNAVLSLLYTFLFNRVHAAVRAVNLDPYPGFLHTPDYGRFSLPLDLMEEFRVIIVDTLTLSLFNLNILQTDDFDIRPLPDPETAQETENTNTEKTGPDVTRDPFGLMQLTEKDACFDLPEQRMDDSLRDQVAKYSTRLPVRLKPEPFNRVIAHFERKLTTEFYYPLQDRKISYADALIAQAGQYRKLVEGSLETYQPLLLK
jgi:CRISPR-associated protein Cas1